MCPQGINNWMCSIISIMPQKSEMYLNYAESWISVLIDWISTGQTYMVTQLCTKQHFRDILMFAPSSARLEASICRSSSHNTDCCAPQHGAASNLPNMYSLTPFDIAIRRGHTSCAKAMRPSGASTSRSASPAVALSASSPFPSQASPSPG